LLFLISPGMTNIIFIPALISQLAYHSSKDIAMKKIKLGSGFAIFIIFFGISLLEAFKSHNWLMAAFWLGMGLLFVVGDNMRKHNNAKAKP
jgi:hypothetical protein